MPHFGFDLFYAHADFYLSPRFLAGLDRRALWSAESEGGGPFDRRDGILEDLRIPRPPQVPQMEHRVALLPIHL